MVIERTLQKLGFNEKEIAVFLALLRRGPQAVRKIAAEAGINRGTTYDILKSLREQGLVAYYHQDTHQYFVAEDPEKLKTLLEQRQRQLEETKKELVDLIPELKSVYDKSGEKPVVKYYDGFKGIKTILLDVLSTMAEAPAPKEYYVYSSADIRKYLYQDFPNFTEERKKRKIRVKIIALGEGGKVLGLDERRWLSQKKGAPTYIITYYKKTAYISVAKDGTPRGIIIEDAGLAQTQRFLFEHLWETLK
ncbi:MAG: helix-turn-helix domain-containing protein [Patescibacteria group bacterium]|nr:helix-turn-helix domain-containing protein [Patescibacteria group bacterium]